MVDWPVKQTVCGLMELRDHHGASVTHLLSILDPGTPEPDLFSNLPPARRLTVRFHDVILDHPDYQPPSRHDVAAILEFGRSLPEGDPSHLLIHCHMGVSRSTAAALALMLQAHPDLTEAAAFDRLKAMRPLAWPNSLMLRHAARLLGRDGLLPALGSFYRRQLEERPEFAQPIRSGGRLAELEMAEAAA